MTVPYLVHHFLFLCKLSLQLIHQRVLPCFKVLQQLELLEHYELLDLCLLQVCLQQELLPPQLAQSVVKRVDHVCNLGSQALHLAPVPALLHLLFQAFQVGQRHRRHRPCSWVFCSGGIAMPPAASLAPRAAFRIALLACVPILACIFPTATGKSPKVGARPALAAELGFISVEVGLGYFFTGLWRLVWIHLGLKQVGADIERVLQLADPLVPLLDLPADLFLDLPKRQEPLVEFHPDVVYALF
mmetsp:Transcript_18326/g.43840  ORF Transcript_18326/g.43840 Transcript_18326/m.43840 type:complete len:244 (+) Transcript_18326:484-1215(+)